MPFLFQPTFARVIVRTKMADDSCKKAIYDEPQKPWQFMPCSYLFVTFFLLVDVRFVCHLKWCHNTKATALNIVRQFEFVTKKLIASDTADKKKHKNISMSIRSCVKSPLLYLRCYDSEIFSPYEKNDLMRIFLEWPKIFPNSHSIYNRIVKAMQLTVSSPSPSLSSVIYLCTYTHKKTRIYVLFCT